MTVYFKCESCGKMDNIGDYDEEAISPPKGWRVIFTTIQEFGDGGVFSTDESETSHSCEDCNANMDVDEHLEAEVTSRRTAMDQGMKK